MNTDFKTSHPSKSIRGRLRSEARNTKCSGLPYSSPQAAKYLSVQADPQKSVKHEACRRYHDTYTLQFTCKAKQNLKWNTWK